MKVGMQDCGYYEGPACPGEKINFTCDASGRYVSITRHGGDEVHLLSLCEVEVWGHPYNYKGGLSVGKNPNQLTGRSTSRYSRSNTMQVYRPY